MKARDFKRIISEIPDDDEIVYLDEEGFVDRSLRHILPDERWLDGGSYVDNHEEGFGPTGKEKVWVMSVYDLNY